LLKVVLGVLVAAAIVGCTGAPRPPNIAIVDPQSQLQIERSPSPFSQVTIGPVHALVPDGWHTFPARSEGDMRGGFVSTPQPRAWRHMDGSTAGMAATWVDSSRVGVPSDFYYLAATGPLLSGLTHSIGCRAHSQRIFVNQRPSFESGPPNAAGDYVASGEGTCHLHGRLTEWAYFVAAPGFGPVHKIGIPNCGLYVVVAVMPRSHRAAGALQGLLKNTSFGGAGIADFVRAARAA
jgi:hypothetical protein